MWGALSDEDGSVFYYVQYVYILHVILLYAFTNLT
jgi:hypothetical protein